MRRPVTPGRRAQAWLEREVEALRASSVPPQRSAASAAALRRGVAVMLLPVEPYLGLTLDEAQERARGEGRHVVPRGPLPRDLDWTRLHVELDGDGRVTEVRTDPPPWEPS